MYSLKTVPLFQAIEANGNLSSLMCSYIDEIEAIMSNLHLQTEYSYTIRRRLENYALQCRSYDESIARFTDVGIEAVNTYKDTEAKIRTVDPNLLKTWSEAIQKVGQITKDKRKKPDLGSVISSISDVLKNLFGFLKEVTDGKPSARSGLMKNIISYIQSSVDFWAGDKKGTDGVVNYLDYTKDSIGLWNGLYKLFQKKYKDLIDAGKGTDIFTDGWIEKGGLLSFAGSSVGFLSSYIEAFKKDYNGAEGIIANFLDTGNDGVDAVVSAKNYSDLLQGAASASGPYTAAGLYGVLAKTGISTVSQVFRSIDDYKADGEWTVEDTAATMVDSSVSGLYAMLSGLTFGFVSEKTTGVSAKDISNSLIEGAKNIGKGIGNFILWLSGKK